MGQQGNEWGVVIKSVQCPSHPPGKDWERVSGDVVKQLAGAAGSSAGSTWVESAFKLTHGSLMWSLNPGFPQVV